MMKANHMDNIKKINIFSLEFLILYIIYFFVYLPAFFKNMPVKFWHLFLKSSNKVAYETAKCVILIRREQDIWSANAKKSEFIRYYKNIVNSKE